ncbi:FecR family protein [Chitinophaga flava]|uniref:Iron dicitrate transport regulator FecR n=1 Tax=Chitinophaga flava TaxID=2259036 RepID=A0A365XRK6_9BACT|nr:FecR family protein [Chitinophaga flava]RBL88986.1 hypothetical protein DF182_20815 [Chitinophaga flava]
MSEFINRIAELITRHLEGKLTAEEEEELQAWISRSDEARAFFERVNEEAYLSRQLERLYAFDNEEGWEKLKEKYPLKEMPVEPVVKRLVPWLRPAAAAAILLAVVAGAWFWAPRSNKMQSAQTMVKSNGISAPGKSRASIILANGDIVYLDSLSQRATIQQAGTGLVKLADDQLACTAEANGSTSAYTYNTLVNPRGSKVINLTLSDGTRVWLNNESSIRFPVRFSSQERTVEVTGEAYFEVAQQATKPFKVKHADWEVQVLGTHFNINSYSDESAAKVTLLEGMVKVTKKEASGIIRPGQQAWVSSAITVQPAADTEAVMAWKNGEFILDGMDLKSLMRQVARWYDVEVVYTGAVEKRAFGGSLDRDLALPRVVQALQENGVKCRLEGRQLIIGN